MQGTAIVRHVVTFGRVLREVGIEVGPGRVADAVRGLDAVDLTRQDDVYFTLRQTLVSRHDELELFDRAFVAWFLARARSRRSSARSRPAAGRIASRATRSSPARTTTRRIRPTRHTSSAPPGTSCIREKDFAEMTPEEFERVRKLMAAIARTRPRRVSRRRSPDPRGDLLDLRRLCRKSLRSGGEPIEQTWKARKSVPRKLVVLCDISGSMDAVRASAPLLPPRDRRHGRRRRGVRVRHAPHAAHARPRDARPRGRARARERDRGRLGQRHADRRLARGVQRDLRRRALSRGAVVVIVSDGWERDDPDLVGREMAKLARAAFAVVWVNPLKGNPEYQPLAGGMRAALPFVDRFLPGHNLRSLEELGAILAGIERRHAA